MFYLWRVWFYIGCLFRFLLHACAIELVEIIAKNCEPPTLSSILNIEEHVIRLYGGEFLTNQSRLLDLGEDEAEPLRLAKWLWTSQGKRWRTRGATCCGAPSSSRRFVSCLKIHEGHPEAIQAVHPELCQLCFFWGGGMEILASYSFLSEMISEGNCKGFLWTNRYFMEHVMLGFWTLLIWQSERDE